MMYRPAQQIEQQELSVPRIPVRDETFNTFEHIEVSLKSLSSDLDTLDLATRYYQQAASRLPQAAASLELTPQLLEIRNEDPNTLHSQLEALRPNLESIQQRLNLKLSDALIELRFLVSSCSPESNLQKTLEGIEYALEKPSSDKLSESLEKLNYLIENPDVTHSNKFISSLVTCFQLLKDSLALTQEQTSILIEMRDADTKLGRLHHFVANEPTLSLMADIGTRAVNMDKLREKITDSCALAYDKVCDLVDQKIVDRPEAVKLLDLLNKMALNPHENTLREIIDRNDANYFWYYAHNYPDLEETK